MLEVIFGSLLVGSLGMDAVMLSGWMRWQQVVTRQQDEEEEETLTRYESKQDSAPAELLSSNGGSVGASKEPRMMGWEFKIVRASSDLFRSSAIFQKLCEEEAQSGWILLEKLDDRRVRFKRAIAMRDIIPSESLSYDPYRSHYGTRLRRRTGVYAIAAVIAMSLPAYLGYVLVSRTLNNSSRTISPPDSPPEKLSFPTRPPAP
ncbi:MULTISPECIES: hypothetical protein [Cyanophyceae]|uniref:hypothetical protein n=1 Tax=Cyanophyceae TaxID=3028117 RepID=UPI001682A289|nr:hypothetical protein [Trichocoleus sp. FACHB-40]MBD2003637.1 hypothetical protein [Trichocoleus sp. FACHB-40]